MSSDLLGCFDVHIPKKLSAILIFLKKNNLAYPNQFILIKFLFDPKMK